jgi:hypothetical protein
MNATVNQVSKVCSTLIMEAHMSRNKKIHTSKVSRFCVILFVAAAMLAWVKGTAYASSPATCTLNNINLGIGLAPTSPSGLTAHVGETNDYQVTIDNNINGNCDNTNVTVILRLPGSATGIIILTNATLRGPDPTLGTPGDRIVCPGDARCFGGANTLYRYVIRAVDLTGPPSNPFSCPPVLDNPSGTPRQVIAYTTLQGQVLIGTGTSVTRCNPLPTIVVTPCLSCTKFCTNGIGENGTITFSGVVLNCGDVDLRSVSVSNLVNGVLTLVTNISTLSPGAGNQVTFRGSYPGNACAPTTDTIFVRGTDDFSGVATSSCSQTCSNITTPCIRVTKVCSTNLVVICGTNPVPITFSGTVSNCGNITLTNVILRDTLVGPNAIVLGPITLAPGASAPWSANLSIGANLCGTSNNINTVTATGTDCRGRGVADTNSCSFSVICPLPRLAVTKACASPIATNIGSSLTVTGQVFNIGDIAFDNVIVVDAQPGLPISATNNLGSLAPGTSKPYSFTYTATTCDPNRDTVTAIGQSACGNVSTNASATCFLCCPAIRIEKKIACLLPGAVCSANEADYGSSATGAKGNTGDPALDNPAFCYLIKVTNTGHDPLTNIVITDALLGLSRTFPGPLAVGGTITLANIQTNWPSSTTNTARVTAQCGPNPLFPGATGNGATVTASTNAVAIVVQANIACAKLVSLNGSAPARTVVQSPCPSDPFTNTVVWYAVVTNTGLVPLHDITIVDEANGDDLPCNVSISLTGVLQPGANSGLVALCTNVYPCTNLAVHNFIRVQGSAGASTNAECVNNRFGTNVIARSDCEASITLCCENPAVLGCRVTGGGRQDAPIVCPDNVRYVTHGGQVGAPVGNSNCVVTLDNIIGNPCIHGRWTHVRHTKGGLEGNFHARYYDTLDCACLGIELSASGLWNDGISEDGRCNPGDKISGPEPRKSPANKIVFTGVGDWADPNGRREPRASLFRVDIEDRSEPGGSHPGGAKEPADRYRIRIWVLSEAEKNRLANPSDGLLDFRNCIAACHGLKYRDGVLASDIDNNCGGAGTLTFPGGCPVRQPDIDDGGELLHGNHQIHPQIKACP